MKYVLLKDIVIKAGTIFDDAPVRREYGTQHSECLIGLTNDSCGTFTYDIDFKEDEKLKKFFARVIE